MASGTVRFTTSSTSDYERIDDGAAYVSGKVEVGSSVKLVYMPGTTAPAVDADALTLEPGETFSYAMGTGESLWVKSTSGPCRVVVVKRAT